MMALRRPSSGHAAALATPPVARNERAVPAQGQRLAPILTQGSSCLGLRREPAKAAWFRRPLHARDRFRQFAMLARRHSVAIDPCQADAFRMADRLAFGFVRDFN